MVNQDGLTHKQWLFCEELLKNGMNVHAAYAVAYPNDKHSRNGPRMLKRKEVIAYLNKRQQQKQATMDKLMDAAQERLQKIIATGSDKDAAKAVEILADIKLRTKELEKELPAASQAPIQVNVTLATPPSP